MVTDLLYRVDPGKIVLKNFKFPLSESQEMPWLRRATDSHVEIKSFCPLGHHEFYATTGSWTEAVENVATQYKEWRKQDSCIKKSIVMFQNICICLKSRFLKVNALKIRVGHKSESTEEYQMY